MLLNSNKKLEQAWLMQTLGSECQHLEQVSGGGNNCIYKLSLADGRNFSLKCYSGDPQDSFERLMRETLALSFLTEHEVTVVPRLYAYDEAKRYAIYEWIAGSRVDGYSKNDIQSILEFVELLSILAKLPEARVLPAAKDANLTAESLAGKIKARIERLDKYTSDYQSLAELLACSLKPLAKQAIDWSILYHQREGLRFTDELLLEHRTLNPSDFGFHNSLRKADGSLNFIDFEYFGWDDPAAMSAVFLWHPAMNLQGWAQQQFLSGVSAIFKESTFKVRLQALYPLAGLLWALILLNEFIPEVWARRVAAGYFKEDEKLEAQLTQLNKAQSYLQKVKQSMEQFPYVT